MAAAGIVVAALVHSHPERLRAPAWVAYCAASSFVVAGVSVAARELGFRRAADGFICLLLAALTAIPLWIAFGGGPRQCVVRGVDVVGPSSEWLCRGVFGFSSAVLGLMLLLAVRSVLRRGLAD